MLKKSKLLLAIAPFILASCGGNNQCMASRDSSYQICAKSGGGTSYKIMGFNLSLLDEKTVSVSYKDFSVEIDGNKITPSCLINAHYHYAEGGWIYENTFEKKDVTSSSTSIYCAWEYSIKLEDATNFYCKNQLVTTSSTIIKI